MKITRTILVGAVLFLAATTPAARAQQVPGMEDDILNSKCTLATRPSGS